ncbi:DUF4127 family protein [Fictibacillus phosphorivorans]|uniref:DUF4127 family protein n=1 Tax=Fictibacillus phosphorivorans TaxID=1221500 RepID=UPI0020420AFF|nr:DUF4127 family protein [Fictibacillus phosphorivorans]MCM3718535.1 DUF4127 family protein [Fictibacillus phosphorivorans]MCM3776109.1 DUF4127 family protein [Fictibacillus phosphorivorans]
MNKKIALVPVDARPVTRDLPRQIAKIGGWNVVVPSKEILGFLKRPGDVNAVREWLMNVAGEVDGFVLSTDMLGYGGLVPSRVSPDSYEVLNNRLTSIKELKEKYPEKPIMAFSATMRISNNYVNEEEKPYWSEYGMEIYSYSYQYHRFLKTGIEEARLKMEEMEKKIPPAILQDYKETREKNFQLNQTLLKGVEDGWIDRLVFPQDDTSEYGMNILEQEKLSREVLEKELFDQVAIYPGADEVANSLIARMIYELECVTKPIFYPFYSGEKGALINALYEDRPIAESVKGQIYAFGSFIEATPGDADVLLAVNVPGKKQGDPAVQLFLGDVDTPDRNIGEWVQRIKHYLGKGYAVAVADVAYANGADPAMIPQLLAGVDVRKLCGFAAWNTAGNTLGTVVAQAAMVHLAKTKGLDVDPHFMDEQILFRLLEDYVYQSVVRQKVRAEVKADAPDLLKRVEKAFLEEGAAFLKKTPYEEDYKVKISNVFLPWNRTFEVGFELEMERK